MGYYREPTTGLTDAQNRVFGLIRDLGEATPGQLLADPGLTIGRVMLQRHLKFLTEKGLLARIGSPPKVYYRVAVTRESEDKHRALIEAMPINDDLLRYLDGFFAHESSFTFQTGKEAFVDWYCSKQMPAVLAAKSKKQTVEQQLKKSFSIICERYYELRNSIEHQRIGKGKLLDATERYVKIHNRQIIDQVFYIDFYALPQFGKTRLGLLVQKAKVGDATSRKYVNLLLDITHQILSQLTSTTRFDACVFIPHSLPRTVKLQNILAEHLIPQIRRLAILKTFPNDIVPQKSIGELSRRIENATITNHILESKETLKGLKRVLIIDDAIGSNATIHAVGGKIKAKNPEVKLVALGIVGSYKSFEVIRDI